MTTSDEILGLCQRILEIPAIEHDDKERLYSFLDDSILNIDDKTVTDIIQGLRERNMHEPFLLDRDAYEYAREAALARAIIKAGDRSPLRGFRSARWYEDAHNFENYDLIRCSPKRILVVGSGPYPTTAMSLMDTFPDSSVDCIDKSKEACELSKEVSKVYGHCLHVIHDDALAIKSLMTYDCVLVGTVVGVCDSEKDSVIEHFLRLVAPRTTLAFRTATGPGRIVYPTVHLTQFDNLDFRILANSPQKTWTTIILTF